ncbi:hypothetical protein PN419_00265 [Halorubrum ezzemoulense]|uniref:hypothetical protein n=1 Tax=Halorubrum ezzemoulense TaxID=337243 RepID=UPI00232C9DEB|nr:hypothetical protein [Halorubrum ezzemoulense]MDB9247440.1 hypothetical protein [Halorubrum ezzemoulense]MDB9258651.1 hypothetical protein [Halorubrum ezzemoulense]MDB9264491.1 hypothetical protein [Halorubrum ezzemoulense]MDB9269012.1 hypothetical protein [Halorubrum ezzemoulense]MDB9271459.1 hypothetical protein [Halorubrum ezzemoulense]
MVSLTDVWPSWGDSGNQPPDGDSYEPKDNVSAATLNHLWYHIENTFSTVESKLNEFDNTLTEIDSDGDGKVDAADAADTAAAVKGNDIDTDGDGKVDAADTADSAATVKGKDIDSDGDGRVDEAEFAANADTVDGTEEADLANENVGIEQPVFAAKSDVPSSIDAGETVVVEGDGLYVNV